MYLTNADVKIFNKILASKPKSIFMENTVIKWDSSQECKGGSIYENNGIYITFRK